MKQHTRITKQLISQDEQPTLGYKKYSSITCHLNLQNCLKKEATLPDWPELIQRV